MYWTPYLEKNQVKFRDDVVKYGYKDTELERLISLAIKDKNVWAVRIYAETHMTIEWLLSALRMCAVTDSINVFYYLETTPLFSEKLVGDVMVVAAERNSIRLLQYLLDNYPIDDAVGRKIIIKGLSWTFIQTVYLILRHPAMTKYVYTPFIHNDMTYHLMINEYIANEKQRRRKRMRSLFFLYIFLVRWAREVKVRPGNSEYLLGLQRFNLQKADLQSHSQI